MPPLRTFWANRHWTLITREKDNTGGKTIDSLFISNANNNKDKWKCKGCDIELAFHKTRMENHESKCPRNLDPNPNSNQSRPTSTRFGDGQQILSIPTISTQEKRILDEIFSSVCYEEDLPFDVFEKSSMKKTLHRLNPAYTPPSRKAIAEDLLETAYDKIKSEIDGHLSTLSHLNIVTDESSNINKTRITNISIHTSDDTFHWLSEDIGALQGISVNITDWLEQHLIKLINNNLQRVNSLAIDTCPTMLAMWKEIRQKPSLKHILVIPCDSHGIQLLIQDLIIQIPVFA